MIKVLAVSQVVFTRPNLPFYNERSNTEKCNRGLSNWFFSNYVRMDVCINYVSMDVCFNYVSMDVCINYVSMDVCINYVSMDVLTITGFGIEGKC